MSDKDPLAGIRERIDAIDASIQSLVSERFRRATGGR